MQTVCMQAVPDSIPGTIPARSDPWPQIQKSVHWAPLKVREKEIEDNLKKNLKIISILAKDTKIEWLEKIKGKYKKQH